MVSTPVPSKTLSWCGAEFAIRSVSGRSKGFPLLPVFSGREWLGQAEIAVEFDVLISKDIDPWFFSSSFHQNLSHWFLPEIQPRLNCSCGILSWCNPYYCSILCSKCADLN